jgi:integrase
VCDILLPARSTKDSGLNLVFGFCLEDAAGASLSGDPRPAAQAPVYWDQIDFSAAKMAIRRVKQGSPSTHPILGDELRALRRLQREQEPKSPFVFTSERGAPFTRAGFSRLVERAGEAAELGFKAHPDMLRHACGIGGRSWHARRRRRHSRSLAAIASASATCAVSTVGVTRDVPRCPVV